MTQPLSYSTQQPLNFYQPSILFLLHSIGNLDYYPLHFNKLDLEKLKENHLPPLPFARKWKDQIRLPKYSIEKIKVENKFSIAK